MTKTRDFCRDSSFWFSSRTNNPKTMENPDSYSYDSGGAVDDGGDLATQLADLKVGAEVHEDSKSDNLVAYIAGSAIGNHKTRNEDKKCSGGIAVYFPEIDASPVGEPLNDEDGVTNIRAEYKAALMAIKRANADHDPKMEKTLEIRTTLKLLVETMYDPRWIDGWKAKKWRRPKNKAVENVDLLKLLLDEEKRGRRIVWEFERKEIDNSTNTPDSPMELTHAMANGVACLVINL